MKGVGSFANNNLKKKDNVFGCVQCYPGKGCEIALAGRSSAVDGTRWQDGFVPCEPEMREPCEGGCTHVPCRIQQSWLAAGGRLSLRAGNGTLAYGYGRLRLLPEKTMLPIFPGFSFSLFWGVDGGG